LLRLFPQPVKIIQAADRLDDAASQSRVVEEGRALIDWLKKNDGVVGDVEVCVSTSFVNFFQIELHSPFDSFKIRSGSARTRAVHANQTNRIKLRVILVHQLSYPRRVNRIEHVHRSFLSGTVLKITESKILSRMLPALA
jgi:hypothetical protein